jgi:hypothetical protein
LSFSSCQRFRHDNRPGMVSQCCGHVNLWPVWRTILEQLPV